MTLPTMLFGFLLSSFYGALFHLWKDGGLVRLIVSMVSSWAGFWIGHILAGQLNWTFWSIGSLHAGLGSIGSLLFLGIGYWLSLVQIEK